MPEQDQYNWGELSFPVQKRESAKALYETPEKVLEWVGDCVKKADAVGIKRLFLMELDWKDICKGRAFWDKFDSFYDKLYHQRDENLNDLHFVEQSDKILSEMTEFKKHFYEWPKRLDIN